MGEHLQTLVAAIFGEGGWPTLLAAIVFALVPLLLLARLAALDVGRCYRMFRRMRAGRGGGRRHVVVGALATLAFADGTLFSRDRRTLVRRARIVLEHELFAPRPDFEWPLSDDYPAYREPGMRPEDGRRGRRRARHAWRRELAAWKADMRRLLAPQAEWTIHVDNPSQINARMSDIQRYFDTLRSVGVEDHDHDRFVCPIEVASGFIAPLHLLTGLLVEFNDKWGPILEAYDRDAADDRGLAMGAASGDMRQIQMFIYNCWLLWGPSIPVCGCRQWEARYRVLQYGFGDENNCIEVVGEAQGIADSLRQLAQAEVAYDRACRSNGENNAAARPLAAMAVPANVRGQLRLSGSLRGLDGRRANALPKAARASWGGGQDERPILFISGIDARATVEDATRREHRHHGHIAVDDAALPSRYYSAYLWVGFVLLARDGDDWQPLSRVGGGAPQPWKDFIPFFEHGNLADPESCAFAKRQLATKAVAAFARLVREWPAAAAHRFAFACAIDESGCGYELAFPEWGGGPDMRALVKEVLDAGADAGDATLQRLRQERIVVFDHFDGRPGRHDYAACCLPAHVAAHYASFDA